MHCSARKYMNGAHIHLSSPFCPSWAWPVPGLREFKYYRNLILQKYLFCWTCPTVVPKRRNGDLGLNAAREHFPSIVVLGPWGTTKQTVPFGWFRLSWLLVDSTSYHRVKAVVFWISESQNTTVSTTLCGFPLFKAKVENLFGGPMFSGWMRVLLLKTVLASVWVE